MRKLMKSLSIAMLSLVMIFCLITPVEVQAASYKANSGGYTMKCGSYYVQRTSKGIYTGKSKKKMKKVKSVKSSGVSYRGFSSNGKYIYYAYKKSIYRIKINGKSLKKICSASHLINVVYYYDGNILYESDNNNDKYLYGDYEDKYKVYSISKKKHYTVCDHSISLIDSSSGKVYFEGFAQNINTGDESTYILIGYDMTKHKQLYNIHADYMNYSETSKTIYYVYVYNITNSAYCPIQVKAVSKSTGKVTNKTGIINAYWGTDDVGNYSYQYSLNDQTLFYLNADGELDCIEF